MTTPPTPGHRLVRDPSGGWACTCGLSHGAGSLRLAFAAQRAHTALISGREP